MNAKVVVRKTCLNIMTVELLVDPGLANPSKHATVPKTAGNPAAGLIRAAVPSL